MLSSSDLSVTARRGGSLLLIVLAMTQVGLPGTSGTAENAL